MTTISAQLHCVHCGADLQGGAFDAGCAHCGHPIADSIDPGLFDSGTMSVSTDASCVGCGYNVRTLHIDAPCPECARPVVQSLRPDELRFADRKWLRRVCGGVTLLLVTAIGIAACLGVFFFAAFSGPLTTLDPAWLFLAVPVAFAVLGCWGVCAAT